MAETVRIEIPIETVDNTDPGLSNITNNLEQMGRTAQRAQSQVNSAEREVSRFDRTSQQTQRGLLSWVKEKYQVLLEAKDKVGPVLKVVKDGLKTVAGKAWNITMKAVDLVTAPVRGIINLLKNPIFQVGAVLGVSIGLKDTVDTFANFEAAMSQVKAISGATGKDFDNLTAKAKEMGANTKFTATESAEAFNYMAMAGWQAGDMLDGIEGILSLAAASGEALGTTSDIVTDALTAFGLKASDSGHFADVLAQASASANTNVGLMGETFKYVGTMAGSLGYSIEDVSLAVGLMANSGLKGSMAGTALNSILTRLSTNTNGATDAIKKLGVEFFNNDGSAREFKSVLDELRVATKDMTDEQKANFANTVAGVSSQKGLLAILNATTEDYDNLSEAIGRSDGASKKMSDTMIDNLQGAFTLLQSVVDGVKISLGERLKPYLLDLKNWLTDQMPDIEKGLMHFMDFIDGKVDSFKQKVAEFTATDEWQNADFFGKVKIAWDEIIAQPFVDWWDSTGHDFIVGKAGSIGRGIGTAISTGLLALLGIDISGAVGEGETVGSAFAKGLIDGFDVDALKSKIGEAIKGIFSNAGKILPGGEEADLSSWLSAAMIAKVASPMLGAGIKGVNLGRSIAGSGAVGSMLGSAGAGTGLLGFGANTAMKLGAGNLAGGGSLSAGALSATGLGASAGAVAAGATLISGGKDFYNAFQSHKEGNKEQAAVEAESGAWKVGGVAAGAAAGAAIGSVVPVLGTAVGALIGAGVGGIGGWIKGNKVKEEYEENLKAAQEAADALALREEQAKYESQDLKDALANTSMTAEEFGQKFQMAVAGNLKEHFGNIKLSLQEISSVAQKLTFDDNIQDVTKFAEASGQTEKSLGNMQSAMSSMEKLNWKASLGLTFDESDMQEYVSGIDSLLDGAKDYIESQHYEAQTAIDLLVGAESDIDMTTGLNAMYAGLQEQLDYLGTELSAKVEVALEDGVITLDEQEEIINLQNQIAEITQKVSDAQTEAEFKALSIKYSGANLDADSFAELQVELQKQMESATQSYDNALKVGIANLELELSEGIINQDMYDEQLQALTDGYEANISEMQIRVENFQLESIAEAYSTELEGILPEIEGTTAEKLQSALHNAIGSGVDTTTWDTETAAKMLGLESLSAEAQTAITEMMSGVAATIPQSIKEDIAISMVEIDFIGPLSAEVYRQLQEAEFNMQSVGTKVSDGVGDAISSADMGQINSAIDMLKANTGSSINTAFSPGFQTRTTVDITADYRLTNPTATINFSGGGSGSATVSANIAKNADGDIINGPILSWVGEDGPEAIIPLGNKRRSRGLSLWAQAGEMLGVNKFANGGVVDNAKYSSNPYVNGEANMNTLNTINSQPSNENELTNSSMYGNDTVPLSSSENTGNTDMHIEIHMASVFEINGGDSGDVTSAIKGNMSELVDDIAGQLAERLKKVYSNMPLKEA